jgi:hypothetical protein
MPSSWRHDFGLISEDPFRFDPPRTYNSDVRIEVEDQILAGYHVVEAAFYVNIEVTYWTDEHGIDRESYRVHSVDLDEEIFVYTGPGDDDIQEISKGSLGETLVSTAFKRYIKNPANAGRLDSALRETAENRDDRY